MRAAGAARGDPGRWAASALLVPSLQPEPLPIQVITPSPCTLACPAGVNVKAYVSLIAEGRFAEALEVVRRRCPLPGVCGRICHHPCEAACKRRSYDDGVAIRALKRFVADEVGELPPPVAPPVRSLDRAVAVAGSGPAGLTAAWDLRLAGFPVTVFEAGAEPGGMLRHGITAYRLPRAVLDAEIEALCRAGIAICTGCRLGRDVDLESFLAQGFAAVLLAVGAQRGRDLGLGATPGHGVVDALSFLRRVNAGDRAPLAGRVAVVGGGSTAVEAARAARRLGASSVTILYRRSREELLAAAEEIAAAEAEGIAFRFLVAPTRLLRRDDGRLAALECTGVGLGEADASGRRRPILIPGSEQALAVDRVLAAVGQEVDLDFVPAELRPRVTEDGLLRADPATTMTPLASVFAAGDAVSGPSTVIDAIASGHRAAEAIRHFLEEGRAAVREQRPEKRAPRELGLPDGLPLEAARLEPRQRRPGPRGDFGEVEEVYTAREAVAEARRCLRCGPCGECRACVPSCGRRHLTVRQAGEGRAATLLLRAPSGVVMGLDPAAPVPGWLVRRNGARTLAEIDTGGADPLELLPVRAQIVEALCRGCGRCRDVCPFDAVRLLAADGGGERARIEAALCRGCNLCTAVCPTHAAQASSLSPEWWGWRLEDAFRAAAGSPEPVEPFVVLACQRRAGALEAALVERGVPIEVVRLRCVGQVVAGMVLELVRHGARRVLVAGCLTDRCRFGQGARLAAREVAHAQALLRNLGADPQRVVADWSGDRSQDPLDLALGQLVLASLRGEAAAGDREASRAGVR